jgi:Protein of unknown function (DUF551)
MNMELMMDSPIAASFSTEAKPESVESPWVHVVARLPDDGEPVQVMLERSREIRIACRGHYQSTGAWFDSQTHTPIYETVTHWKARD